MEYSSKYKSICKGVALNAATQTLLFLDIDIKKGELTQKYYKWLTLPDYEYQSCINRQSALYRAVEDIELYKKKINNPNAFQNLKGELDSIDNILKLANDYYNYINS